MLPEADFWRPAAIFAFEDNIKQARQLAALVGAAASLVDAHRFPDGESLVTVAREQVRGKTVALYRSLHNPNGKLVEVLLAAAALRDGGAERLILVAPYLPYMRQDRAFRPGQAVSQMVIGELIGQVFDGVITVQPHLHRTASLDQVFVGKPALALPAAQAIAKALEGAVSPATVVAGPDEESLDLARDVATHLGLPWTNATKHRHGDNQVDLSLPKGLSLAGASAVIVDDVISTGGTVIALARALRAAGVASIDAYVAHAMYDEEAAFLMSAAGIRRVVSLDGVAHVTNGISVVGLIAKGMGMTE